MSMRTAAAALLFAAVTGSAFATDVNLIANSAIKAFSDYCEPLFFQENRIGEGTVNAELVLNYSRALFMKYEGDCTKFRNSEVVPSHLATRMVAEIAELQRDDPRTLTRDHLAFIGQTMWLSNLVGQGCVLSEFDKRRYDRLFQAVGPVFHEVVTADALDIARTYQALDLLMNTPSGPPMPGSGISCATEPAMSITALTAASLGLIAAGEFASDSPDMTMQQFEELMREKGRN